MKVTLETMQNIWDSKTENKQKGFLDNKEKVVFCRNIAQNHSTHD